eukprot:TRINITY_DN2859_c0_g4_i2.p1 TRINITY_DN2859_c0_g4~~TRINITY_DN2859_c0_g4_i2.p1  ORF type:complete len:832 (-),score=218.06 TRINITY_DN2859_c0_g4_i2:1386-3881(-)
MSRRKLPTKWADVDKEDTIDDLIELDQSKSFKQVGSETPEVVDPLGVTKETSQRILPTSVSSEDRTTSNPPTTIKLKEIWNSENFSAADYLSNYHKDTPIHELELGLKTLKNRVDERKNNLIQLVRENFHRFVACKASIDTLYSRLKEGSESVIGIRLLESTLKGVRGKGNSTFHAMITRQQEVENIRSVLSILNRVKFRFIFSLPRTMREEMQKNEKLPMEQQDYSHVVWQYKKVKVWLADTHVAMFRRVLQQADNIIKELVSKLFSDLSDISIPQEHHDKIIRLLVSLGNNSVDPAWHCLASRYNKICDKLKKLAAEETGNDEFHSTIVIRNLCSVIQDQIPPFWKMAKSFFNGEYHNKLNDVEREVIESTYTEERFSSMFKDVFTIFVSAVNKHFFGEDNKHQKSLLKKTRLPLIQLKNTPDDDETNQDKDDFSLGNRSSKTQQHQQVDQQDEDKQKLRAVIDCVKILKEYQITYQFAEPMITLVSNMTTAFVSYTFHKTFESVKFLHTLETWEVIDRTSMITTLPGEFSKTITNALKELKGVVEIEDQDAVNEIESNFVECLNSFSDNMHHLAFEDSDDEHVYGHNESVMSINSELEAWEDYDDEQTVKRSRMNTKMILILNNLEFVKVKIIPDLIKRYRSTTQLAEPDPNMTVASLIDQLSEMVKNKYLRSHTIPISITIKKGILCEGFDWTRNTLNKDVRNYVMELMVIIVSVHEELNKLLPVNRKSQIDKVLTTLLELIYENFIYWLSYVDKFSSYGKIQVGIELLFIDRALVNFKASETSKKMWESLDKLLNLNTLDSRIVKEILERKVKTSQAMFSCFLPEI